MEIPCKTCLCFVLCKNKYRDRYLLFFSTFYNSCSIFSDWWNHVDKRINRVEIIYKTFDVNNLLGLRARFDITKLEECLNYEPWK